MKKHFRVIFSDFCRISCDFRLDIRDFGKKNVRSRETRKNQGNLEAAVKGNSHGGLAGMVQSLINLPSDTLLVTLDVSTLYTNIPYEEGIAVCIEALNTRETQSPPTADLAELISEILNENVFVFVEQHYL